MRFRRSVGTAIAVGGALVALSACSSESPQDHAVDLIASCIAQQNCGSSLDTSVFADNLQGGGTPAAAASGLDWYSKRAAALESDSGKLKDALIKSEATSGSWVSITTPGETRSLWLKFDSAGKIVATDAPEVGHKPVGY